MTRTTLISDKYQTVPVKWEIHVGDARGWCNLFKYKHEAEITIKLLLCPPLLNLNKTISQSGLEMPDAAWLLQHVSFGRRFTSQICLPPQTTLPPLDRLVLANSKLHHLVQSLLAPSPADRDTSLTLCSSITVASLLLNLCRECVSGQLSESDKTKSGR